MSGHICPERLLLPEALTGRLEPAEEKRVMAHLETCPACQDAAADIEVALISLETLRVAGDELVLPRWSPLEAAPGLHVVANDEASSPPRTTPDGQPNAEQHDPVVTPIRRRSAVGRTLFAAAAAVILLVCGAAAGHELLPPRESDHYGPAVALAPPAGASSDTASGSVAVAHEGDALAVKLTATDLPAAGWYECVWNSNGQTRSAGSFRADKGAVDVELRVAPPKAPGAWDLQVIAHTGTSSQVVLEGSAPAPT